MGGLVLGLIGIVIHAPTAVIALDLGAAVAATPIHIVVLVAAATPILVEAAIVAAP